MQVLQDLQYAARKLGRAPGFACTAVLTLALGIGAATAVFSVAYGVLIDPFPYKDVHHLATPKLCAPEWPRCHWLVYSPEHFLEIEQKTDIFSGVTASTISDVTLTGSTEPQRLRGNYITPNTFDVLGVQPMLGRASTAEDVRPGHGEVALLSYRFWQAHLGGDRSVLGRVMTFNGHPRTIIGIMPPRFLWRGGDVYLPIAMTGGEEEQGQRYFTFVGRLRPGVTDAQAEAELKPVFEDIGKSDPHIFPRDMRVSIMSFDQMFQSDLAEVLYLLLASVFVLLLIACVNVSSLLLARAVQREHEFVVRASIGASRWAIVRQALMESLLLAAIAMPLALAFAWAGLQATLRIVPTETIPDEAVVTLNLPVLLVSIGIALLTVVVFGMAPAWHSANPRLSAALGSGSRSSGRRGQRRLLASFVVVEIALSVALLTLANLMVHSLLAVQSVPISFSPDHTLAVRVPLTADRYKTAESRIAFFRQLLDGVRAIPGVRAATVDASYPLIDAYGLNVQIPGRPADTRFTGIHLVDPQYLEVSGMKLIEGHFIDQREVTEGAHDVVVTRRFVRRYFQDGDALGRTFEVHGLDHGNHLFASSDRFTIVGVLEDLPEIADFRGDTSVEIFLPYSAAPPGNVLLVATRLPAEELENAVRQAVYALDKNQPVAEMMTVRQLLDMYGYAGPRFSLALFGTFAAAALLLSVVGIYGVLSFVTSQRTQEIGIRMALGADRGRVMWMVLRHACLLALAGVVAGLPLAMLAGRFARDELFRTSQHDLSSIVAAVLILPLLAVAGTLLPARRAAAIDPARALRAE
jgi:putative ABC transport system permease protein